MSPTRVKTQLFRSEQGVRVLGCLLLFHSGGDFGSGDEGLALAVELSGEGLDLVDDLQSFEAYHATREIAFAVITAVHNAVFLRTVETGVRHKGLGFELRPTCKANGAIFEERKGDVPTRH